MRRKATTFRAVANEAVLLLVAIAQQISTQLRLAHSLRFMVFFTDQEFQSHRQEGVVVGKGIDTIGMGRHLLTESLTVPHSV